MAYWPTVLGWLFVKTGFEKLKAFLSAEQIPLQKGFLYLHVWKLLYWPSVRSMV